MFTKKNWLYDCAFLVLFLGVMRTSLDLTRSMFQSKITYEENKSFVFHEPDKEFVALLEQTELHLATLAQIIQTTTLYPVYESEIDSMKKNLDEMKKKLVRTSPALFFLGPLGTTSVVLKEKDLEKELLNVVNTIGHITHTCARYEHEETSYKPADSVVHGVAQNKQYLRSMHASQIFANQAQLYPLKKTQT